SRRRRDRARPRRRARRVALVRRAVGAGRRRRGARRAAREGRARGGGRPARRRRRHARGRGRARPPYRAPPVAAVRAARSRPADPSLPAEKDVLRPPLVATAARLRTWVAVLRTAVTNFHEVGPFQLAAALSYYMLLSLAPLVLVAVTVASMVFGRESVAAKLV